MAKLKALRNLTIGVGKNHRQVKAGHVFEVSDDYAADHLHEHHAEETDEPVTVEKTAPKKSKKVEEPKEPKDPKDKDGK